MTGVGWVEVSVRRLRLVVAVVALGFVLALMLGSVGLLGGGRALGSSTTISVIGGDVSVRHGTSGTYVAAVDGEVLNAGDSVRTADGARAVLTYFEGSTVTIEPNTELTINAASAQGNDTVVLMTQSVGRTWHVVTKLVQGGSKYEVHTPASTASVRGTAFTVDTDGSTTTITTTEGTVIDSVPDPANPGRTIDVPVGPGQRHTQGRGQPPASTGPAPEPERTVTISLSDEDTIVIDTLGRANGIDKNGKTHLETPGAKLEKIDGHLVITLPDIPDGRLQALAHSQGNVEVQTTVQQRGQSPVTTTGTLSGNVSGQAVANVDIHVSGAGAPTVQETQASPAPSASATATPTQATSDAGSGGSTDAGSSSGGGGGDPGNGNGNGASGNGNGQGGRPTATPGFVPTASLPAIPGGTPTPTPAQSHGQGGGGTSGGGTTGGGNGNGNGGSSGGGNGGAKSPPPRP